MKAKKKFTYSLHFTTSFLFITLVLVFGGILSWQNYSKTSQILLDTGDQVFDQINNKLVLEFSALRKSVKQNILFIAQSPISDINTLLQPKSLSRLSTALAIDSIQSAIQIGYPNGDYFIIRPVRSDKIRKVLNAPEGTSYVVDIIISDPELKDKRPLLILYFDKQFNEISRNTVNHVRYDPRERPWYKLALTTDQPIGTEPYLFHFSRKVGLTLTTITPYQGIVVAAEVTLGQLSSTLQHQNATPSSKIVVFKKNADIIAYSEEVPLVINARKGVLRMAKLADLGDEALTFLSQDIKLETQSLNFQVAGQTWIGGVRELPITEGAMFYVLMVSPEKELLSSAIKIREHSLLITALIILFTIPIVWFFSHTISSSLHRLATEAGLISNFDFSSPIKTHSMISEVEELSSAMNMMKETISQFLSLIHSLSDEKNLDALLQKITQHTMEVSEADGAVTYLYNEQENTLEPRVLLTNGNNNKYLNDLPMVTLDDHSQFGDTLNKKESSLIELSEFLPSELNVLLDILATETATMIVLPLRNRQADSIGMLCLLYKPENNQRQNDNHINFVQALSGFAAVSIESRQLLMMQKALLASFIKLIADAIDSKSPYTGSHCARVPELTKLIAQAACTSKAPPFQDFQLDEDQWEALHIASWLHDCGKVTTPEYVVDKATKLETIYDRIHEIRMRIEVLKRDAEIGYWQQVAKGGNTDELRITLDKQLLTLDQDFTFIAECNVGSESMAPEKVARLAKIANYTWTRTLNDTIGISWEENERKQRAPESILPVEEKLLADRVDHIIERDDKNSIAKENPWGFKIDVPEHKYNRGELYNLSIERGTLTEEERYKINDHIVQTIIMLETLPYPKHLRDVPSIAGAHHETMDGTGYPKRLTSEDMPLTAKMMAIADIFEALTASDRPYKKAKPLSEAIRIMSRMVKKQHIDSELFNLFLSSGVYLQYAKQYLNSAQIDEVDIKQYIS